MRRAAAKGGLVLLLLLLVAGLAGCGAPVVDAGWSALGAGAGRLYVGLAGKFTAVDPASANAVWQYPEKEQLGGFYGAPVLAEGRVIFAASDVAGHTSQVYSLSAETGQDSQVLVSDLKELIIGAPAVYGDTLYVTSADGNVYVRDLKGGETRLLVRADGPIWGSVVRDGDRVYFGTMGHSVYSVDLSGKELWRFKTEAAVPGTPAVAGGRVYVGDVSGRLYALDAQTGEQAWAPFRAANWMWGQPVVVGDTLYAPSLDGNVYALDAATGVERPDWRIGTSGAVSARPTLVGDTLYVASESGFLHAVDVTTHKDRWAPFKTEGQLLTSPVVVDNAVYVTTSKGKVYMVDAATGNGRQLYPQPK